MASIPLTSHHVNYLIWRYLQESGHGEPAIMLQRAWNSDPQSLPFAPYIKTHALITLIQKGLLYYDLEQSLLNGGQESTSFFGPSALETGTTGRAEGGADVKEVTTEETAEPTSAPSEQLAPRVGPLVNGQHISTNVQDGKKADDGVVDGSVAKGDIAMETEKEAPLDAPSPAPRSSVAPTEGVLDADGDTGMAEAEESGPPTPVFTLTTGQSIGVQISPVKAADLTPDTTLVDVLGETHMMRTAWRPHDPLVFAAASDTLCALWKLSGQRSSLAPTSTTLVTSSCVTALDWDSSGKMIAVATYDNLMGTITLYDKDGSVLEVLPESPRLISGLRWAGNGLQIVIVASDGQSSELFLWNQGSQQDLFSHPQLIDGPIYDTVWCTEKFVYVCGDGFVYQCLVGDKIETSQSFSSGDDHEPWTLLKAVLNTEKPVAVAASTPTAHIWIPTHDIHIRSAHDGDITGLEIRPTSKSDESQKISPIIIATSSMDDTVKIWSFDLPTNQVHCTHRLFLGTACPALALSFSPDGYAVAAASYNKLSIWNVDRGGTPLATWDGASAEAKGEGSMELDLSDASMLDRPLSWDTDGKKLALGYGKKMAIINLQR